MPQVKKYIIIIAPHTSNWDFFIGVAARSILNFNAKYLAKKELFRFPIGWIFRLLGGVPVDRSEHRNLVDAVAELFNSHNEFIVAIAPEGTRKYVPRWKTGFYYIALKANIPIVMVSFNYPDKSVVVRDVFFPTGDASEDIKTFADFYKDKQGKYPKKFPENFFHDNI